MKDKKIDEDGQIVRSEKYTVCISLKLAVKLAVVFV